MKSKTIKIYDYVGSNCISKSQGQHIAEEIDIEKAIIKYQEGLCFDLKNVIVIKTDFFNGLFEKIIDNKYALNIIKFNNASLTHMKIINAVIKKEDEFIDKFNKDEVNIFDNNIKAVEGNGFESIDLLADKFSSLINKHFNGKPNKKNLQKQSNSLKGFIDNLIKQTSDKKINSIPEKDIFKMLGIEKVFKPSEEEMASIREYMKKLEDPEFQKEIEARTEIINKNMKEVLQQIKEDKI